MDVTSLRAIVGNEYDPDLGDRNGESIHLSNLAEAHKELGETRLARELLEQSLDVTREMGHRQREADVLSNLSEVCELIGDKPGAAACLRDALLIWGELRSPRADEARKRLEELEGK